MILRDSESFYFSLKVISKYLPFLVSYFVQKKSLFIKLILISFDCSKNEVLIKFCNKTQKKLMRVVPKKLMIVSPLFVNIYTKTHEIKEKYFVNYQLRTWAYFFVMNFLILKYNLFLKLYSKFDFFQFWIFSIHICWFMIILTIFTDIIRTMSLFLSFNKSHLIFNGLKVKMKECQIKIFKFFQKNKRKDTSNFFFKLYIFYLLILAHNVETRKN